MTTGDAIQAATHPPIWRLRPPPMGVKFCHLLGDGWTRRYARLMPDRVASGGGFGQRRWPKTTAERLAGGDGPATAKANDGAFSPSVWTQFRATDGQQKRRRAPKKTRNYFSTIAKTAKKPNKNAVFCVEKKVEKVVDDFVGGGVHFEQLKATTPRDGAQQKPKGKPKMQTTTQTATISTPREAIKGRAHRLENAFRDQYSVIDCETGREIVTLRTYSKTGARWTACLWVSCGDLYASGSGQATGYGYHKPSAAAQVAIDSAGITLAKPIEGRGDSAIEDAVRAIAEAAAPHAKTVFIHANA